MRDAMLIGGVSLVGIGCWQYHPGLASVVVGTVLLILSTVSFFWKGQQ
jgi:hypothetical protein